MTFRDLSAVSAFTQAMTEVQRLRKSYDTERSNVLGELASTTDATTRVALIARAEYLRGCSEALRQALEDIARVADIED